MLIIVALPDSGTIKLTLLLELNPTLAAFPPVPLTPLEASPVVHCIKPSAYKYIAKDSVPSVTNTH